MILTLSSDAFGKQEQSASVQISGECGKNLAQRNKRNELTTSHHSCNYHMLI